MAIPSVALLVHACDRYRFLYPGFHFFFKKNWDAAIPCKLYFATEEVDAQLPDFTNLKSSKGEWSDRLRILLEGISEDYVLYFQEDMWLNKPVDKAFFENLFQLAGAQNLRQIKLHSSEVYKTIATENIVAGFRLAEVDKQASGYLMSHQITLWHRETLLQFLAKNENPWRNERRATKKMRKSNLRIHHLDYFAENGKAVINQNPDSSHRSEYFTVSVNSVLNEFVLPFLPQLQEAGPQEQIYAAQLRQHFEKKITHDGLAKPRKEDIFQRMKKRLRGL